MDLSIVTITYQDPSGLESTMRSLQGIRALEWEQVVVDSSPERNEAVIRKWGHPGLVRLKEEPRGIYPALNAGLSRARGEFVLFLNGGDRLKDPLLLARLLEEMRRDGEDLCCASADLYRDGAYLYTVTPRERFLDNLIGANRICHQAVLYRRKSLEEVGPFLERWRLVSDYEHHYRCYLAGLKVRCSPVVLAEYDMGGKSQNYRAVLAEFEDVYRQDGFPEELRVRNLRALRWERLRLTMVKGLSRFSFLRPAWIVWKRAQRRRGGD